MIKTFHHATYFCFLIFFFVSSCKASLQPVNSNEKFLELIDLNNITMVPHKNYKITGPEKIKTDPSSVDYEPETVKFQKNDQGKFCVVLDLTFRESGINIIESIKKGEILDNNIVIRDSSGRIVGKSSINFQAFTIYKTMVAKMQTNEVLTDSGERISLEEKQKKEQPKYKVEQVSYSDGDKVPQPICIGSDLQSGNYISVTVELTYIQPFLNEICHTSQKNCVRLEKEIMRGANQHFQKKISDKEAELTENPEKNTRFSFSMDDWDIARKSIKDAIHKISDEIKQKLKNNENPLTTEFGNEFKYREFKLIGAPRYFKVMFE